MSTVDKSGVKNAPLTLTEDGTDFMSWATSVADGSISAGWQSMHPQLAAELPTRVLRTSGARLVSLTRRELNQTPGEVAATAGVPVSDVVALEHGDDVSGHTIIRVANALHLNADVLVQLFGFTQVFDPGLVAAATEFVVHLEPTEPLHPGEVRALGKFREVVQAGPDRGLAG